MFNKYKKRYETIVNVLLAKQDTLIHEVEFIKNDDLFDENNWIYKQRRGQLFEIQSLLKTVNQIDEAFK